MKNLSNIIGWIAATMSIAGTLLNAYMVIWCWLIWIISNFIWIWWAVKKKEWSQVVLWSIFIISNFYGWYQWSIK